MGSIAQRIDVSVRKSVAWKLVIGFNSILYHQLMGFLFIFGVQFVAHCLDLFVQLKIQLLKLYNELHLVRTVGPIIPFIRLLGAEVLEVSICDRLYSGIGSNGHIWVGLD